MSALCTSLLVYNEYNTIDIASNNSTYQDCIMKVRHKLNLKQRTGVDDLIGCMQLQQTTNACVTEFHCVTFDPLTPIVS